MAAPQMFLSDRLKKKERQRRKGKRAFLKKGLFDSVAAGYKQGLNQCITAGYCLHNALHQYINKAA